MGLLKAAVGAIGGSLADQWIDFLSVPEGIEPTAALFPAIRKGENAGRGSNTISSQSIITNGSRIIVPEGFGLLLFQDGEITGYVNEPGAYIWDSTNVNSQTVFASGNLWTSIVKQSWERFKFGGRPSGQQIAVFINLNEIPNIKFGTQSEIYYDDGYLNAQVGVTTRGVFSVSILDPILFAKNFVPVNYLQGYNKFDFADRGNASANQIFSEVVGSLASAFSLFTNDSNKLNRITRIQTDATKFAQALGEVVEGDHQWKASRGIAITRPAILGIEYDSSTKELLKLVQRADALKGDRGNSNLQAAFAEGITAAGQNDGSSGILGLGIATGSLGLQNLMQAPIQSEASASEKDLNAGLLGLLKNLKQAFEAGLIDQTEYNAARAKALGL